MGASHDASIGRPRRRHRANAQLGPRTLPGEGKYTVEAWKKANDGRDPDFAAIRAEMAGTKMSKMISALEKSGVTVSRDVESLSEARFSLDKAGKGKLQLPPTAAYRSVDHQASSTFTAIAHANVATEAQRVAAKAPANEPDANAEQRVAAYQLPPSKQAKSPAYAEAELVATYAALHETTSLALEYQPSPSVANVEMQERWAKKFEEPGGMADVGRQVSRTVNLNEELAPSRPPGRFRTTAQLGAPEQAGRSAGDAAAGAAAGLRRDLKAGGNPDVEQPSQRPGESGPGEPSARDRKQTQTH